MKMRYALATDIGRVREENEDAVGVRELPSGDLLFIVADGMGGHQAGEVASRMVVEEVYRFLCTASPKMMAPAFSRRLSEDGNMMSLALRYANKKVYASAQEQRSRHGMGSTAVAALWREGQKRTDILGERLTIAHVGDSRAYRIRRRASIRQLTEDHNLAAVVLKTLAPADAAKIAKRDLHANIVTRAMGTNAEVVPDVKDFMCEVGDTFVLCSDGLNGMVSDEEIQSLASGTSLRSAAALLVGAANREGGEDNVSVIVMRAVD